MEIPDSLATMIAGAVAAVVAGETAAIVYLFKENRGLQTAIRAVERGTRRTLRLARHAFEKRAAGHSEAPLPEIDEEPSIVRRIEIDRDQRFFEDQAKIDAENDVELRTYLQSSRPPPPREKPRIRLKGKSS